MQQRIDVRNARTPETDLIAKESFAQLTPDSKEVCEAIFNSPYGTMTMTGLSEQLRNIGWKAAKIQRTFAEIKGYLRHEFY